MGNTGLAIANNGNNALGGTLTNLDPITLAGHFVNSGFFKDAADVSKAVVKIMYGQEQGIPPVTAMLNVYIVEGKPSMSAQMIAAVLRRAGYDYRVTEWTDQKCEIEFYDKQHKPMGVSTYTMQDAQKAQLAGRATWQRYPKAMLWARAISQGARAHTPDASLGAIYTPDELGAEIETNEQGDILSVKDVTPPQPSQHATRRELTIGTVPVERKIVPHTGEIVDSTPGPMVSLGNEYTSPTWAQTIAADVPNELDEAFPPEAPEEGGPKPWNPPYPLATEAQMKAIANICKRLGLDMANVVMETAEMELDVLSKDGASHVIEALNKRAAAK